MSKRHRRPPPPRLSKRSSPDNFGTLDDLFGLLRDNLGKADAFITSAEYQLEQAPSVDEDEELRRRGHVEHLVESAKFAVRAAGYTTECCRAGLMMAIAAG
jgi:hypothetical protein